MSLDAVSTMCATVERGGGEDRGGKGWGADWITLASQEWLKQLWRGKNPSPNKEFSSPFTLSFTMPLFDSSLSLSLSSLPFTFDAYLSSVVGVDGLQDGF